MPDPFSTLPLPLPTIILSGLEDLGTLHCLLQASSAVHAIFAMQYCEITESILSNFLPQLRQLLRVVVYIRSQSSNIRRQSDCIDAYNDFRGAYILAPNAGVSPLAKSTATLGAVRSLVQTASHVQNLAASFFVAHLERVNKIKPYRSLDGAASRDDQWTAIPGPMVIQYDIMECGEPSWVEEHRILRALWRAVVYFDLLVITDRVRGGKSDVHDMLLALGARGVWSWSYPGGRRREDPLGLWPSAWQELDCVLDYLAEISNQEVNPADEMPPHLQKLPTLSFESLSTPMKVPSEDFTAVMQGQWHPELAATSPGYHFFHVHQAYRQRGLCAIVGLDFKPFRRLGLGIWDREKLRRLGLCNYPDKKVENYEELYVNSTYTKWEMFLRWRSLVVEGDFQS